MFDILNEDASDIGEDDPTEEQVEDNTGEDDKELVGFDRARHCPTGVSYVLYINEFISVMVRGWISVKSLYEKSCCKCMCKCAQE